MALHENKRMITVDTVDQKTSLRLKKLQKRIRRLVGKAIEDFQMIENEDKVMVCLSGGKDSYTMLEMLLALRSAAPVSFDIVAVNLDQKQPNFPEHILPNYLSSIGVDYHILEQDTYSVVKRVVPERKTMCGLCSRLRRGALYTYAEQAGFTKIALGHHRDDILETFFMNLFHGGKVKTMPPKLRSDDGKHVVIRPLAYCSEKDIEAFAKWRGYPIIPCNLCGSQTHLQRVVMKKMLAKWEKNHSGRLENIFTALQNVVPSHLLDVDLYNFDTFSHVGDKEEAVDMALSPPGDESIVKFLHN